MIPFICCPVAGRRSAFVTPDRSTVPVVEAFVGTVVEGTARVVVGATVVEVVVVVGATGVEVVVVVGATVVEVVVVVGATVVVVVVDGVSVKILV
jgi:hypothetical protein